MEQVNFILIKKPDYFFLSNNHPSMINFLKKSATKSLQ